MSKHWILAILLAIGIGCATTAVRAEEKEKEEGSEVKVKFDQVPAAVQKTLTDEAKGAKIDEVDKETDDGKTIYEADVTLNGHNYEIKVAEDGTLICKKLDEGKEEKGEKKGEDESKEKK